MKPFFTLILLLFSFSSFAESNFDKYLGEYEVLSEECTYNGTPDSSDSCKLSGVTVSYDEDVLRLYQIGERGGSIGYPIEEYDLSDDRNTYKAEITNYEDGTASWTHTQIIFQTGGDVPTTVTKKLEIHPRANNEVLYVFLLDETSPFTRPKRLMRYYTLKLK